MKFSLFVCLFLSLQLISCKEQSKERTIPEDVLVDVYANTLILQEKRKMSGKDSLWLSGQIDSLYRSRHVERSEADSTIQDYQQELIRWKAFYEKVVIKLEAINQEEIAKPQSQPR